MCGKVSKSVSLNCNSIVENVSLGSGSNVSLRHVPENSMIRLYCDCDNDF